MIMMARVMQGMGPSTIEDSALVDRVVTNFFVLYAEWEWYSENILQSAVYLKESSFTASYEHGSCMRVVGPFSGKCTTVNVTISSLKKIISEF